MEFKDLSFNNDSLIGIYDYLDIFNGNGIFMYVYDIHTVYIQSVYVYPFE